MSQIIFFSRHKLNKNNCSLSAQSAKDCVACFPLSETTSLLHRDGDEGKRLEFRIEFFRATLVPRLSAGCFGKSSLYTRKLRNHIFNERIIRLSPTGVSQEARAYRRNIDAMESEGLFLCVWVSSVAVGYTHKQGSPRFV